MAHLGLKEVVKTLNIKSFWFDLNYYYQIRHAIQAYFKFEFNFYNNKKLQKILGSRAV